MIKFERDKKKFTLRKVAVRYQPVIPSELDSAHYSPPPCAIEKQARDTADEGNGWVYEVMKVVMWSEHLRLCGCSPLNPSMTKTKWRQLPTRKSTPTKIVGLDAT
jgi:hypothetical protein